LTRNPRIASCHCGLDPQSMTYEIMDPGSSPG
jgi:hypothetical protein